MILQDQSPSAYGYIPHADQSTVTCPRCGNGVFTCPAQCVSSKAPVWTWEHICTKCGHYIGVTVKRDPDVTED